MINTCTNKELLFLLGQLSEELWRVWRVLHVHVSDVLYDSLQLLAVRGGGDVSDGLRHLAAREPSLLLHLLGVLQALHLPDVTCLLLVRVATGLDGCGEQDKFIITWEPNSLA